MNRKNLSRRAFLGLTLAAGSYAAMNFNHQTVMAGDVPNLEEWLGTHPKIRDSIVWLVPNQKYSADKLTYASWDAARKNELSQAFAAAWKNLPTNLPLVPQTLSPPTDAPATVLTPTDGWNFYKANLAQSFALEIGSRVPWSIKGYSAANLAILFDAEAVFMWDANLKGYRITADQNGYFTPAPPDLIFKFLTDIKVFTPQRANKLSSDFPSERSTKPVIIGRLIETDRRAAIAKIFDWMRRNMLHFAGGYTTENMTAHWQYTGYPPIARVIGGTKSTAYPVDGLYNWTGGCYGTTGFLNGVLRTINIPVRQVKSAGHSQAHFTSENLYLSHSDDPYTGFSRAASKTAAFDFPSDELLISSKKYNEWFGAGASNPGSNIARQPSELAVKYLPHNLLKYYCEDQKSGKSKAAGKFFDLLKPHFTLTQLDAAQLWERLEKKAAEKKSCQN